MKSARLFTILMIIPIIIAITGVAFGSGIMASPGSFNLDFNTAKTYQGQITVENIGNEPINITVDKKRIQKDNLYMIFSDTGAATWITIDPTNFALEPHQIGTINFNVAVPNDTNYFDAAGAIIITGNNINSNVQNGINLNRVTEIVIPIYIGLPGPINESLQLLEHKAPSVLLSFMPGDFEYTLKNNGTVVVNMNGTIEFNGWFTKSNATMEGKVYPEDQFYMFTKWEPNFWDFGVYDAKTTINYGRETQDKILETNDTVIVIPVWLIIIVLLVITVWIIRKKGIKSPIEIKRRKK
ncbi:MAG: hypothetical protein ACXVHY_03325 [Methanobacterium sp.]